MVEHLNWSKSERAIARKAFNAAYELECAGILEELRKRVGAIDDSSKIWKINDYLWKKRREMDDKYDFRGSVLVEVLSRLIYEGWITLDDLQGLRQDKIDFINRYLSFFEAVS